jgi:hypothetical protein
MTTALADLTRYQLVALAPDGAVGGWRRVGSYHDLDSTLRAHVEDVLDQLAANDGWLVCREYLIIGPGPDGRMRVTSAVTEIGADPHSDRVPDPYDEPATRRWLLAAASLPATS